MTDRRTAPDVEPEMAAMVFALGVPEEGRPAFSLLSSPPPLTSLGNGCGNIELWEEGCEATFLRGPVCEVRGEIPMDDAVDSAASLAVPKL